LPFGSNLCCNVDNPIYVLPKYADTTVIVRITNRKEINMKYGARNDLKAVVKSVKKGDIMSLVKFDVAGPAEMASVLTTESVDALALKPGDKVELVIKAIHVLPVKE
jgi:molybdopterin-binding protein